ncbi:hypothetical protein NGC89_08580 [Staphylococcus xylosus]|uniref:hypothetical protein n=1 Tax=Staphylococcus xylosus TaxID=1288 RepID=UPI002DB6D94C|nr:hypothetical protein [Staphylococcus xylosus]MEB7801503.1 hypothetical protein [Staphylococcus xylosus]
MLDSDKLTKKIGGIKNKYPYTTYIQESLSVDDAFQREKYYLSFDRKNHELIVGYLFKLINKEYYWIALSYLKLPNELGNLTEDDIVKLEKIKERDFGHTPISSFTNFKKAQNCLKYELEGKQNFDEFIAHFNNSK